MAVLSHGFRFVPSDDDIVFYLKSMISGQDLHPNPVTRREVYEDEEPWVIFDSIDSQDPEDEYRYVFTSIQKKFVNAPKMLKRTAGCGSWRSDGKVDIKDSSGRLVGLNVSFKFRIKDDSSSRRGTKSLCTPSRTPSSTTTSVADNFKWIMHEFTLSNAPNYAICKIRRMPNDKKQKSNTPSRVCNPLDMYLSNIGGGSYAPLGFASDTLFGFGSDAPLASSTSSENSSPMPKVQVQQPVLGIFDGLQEEYYPSWEEIEESVGISDGVSLSNIRVEDAPLGFASDAPLASSTSSEDLSPMPEVQVQQLIPGIYDRLHEDDDYTSYQECDIGDEFNVEMNQGLGTQSSASNNNYHFSISPDLVDRFKNENWKHQEDLWSDSEPFWSKESISWRID